jgi:hypothetical protein
MIIIKNRGTSAAWAVNHTSIGATQYLNLNTTGVAATDTTVFQNRSSSVVTLGTDGWVNGNTMTYVMYCWASIAGYSAFGSYTGNGSTDGPFIYTGFRPRYLMIKSSSNAAVWYVWDSSRDPYNFVSHELYLNASDAEYVNTAECDFLSNGFKMRSTFTDQNGSGRTYIYMAFAEMPFKYSRSR